MVMEKLDSNMHKNETRPISYTIHRNKFKMDVRPKCETGNYNNTGSNLFDLRPYQLLTRYISRGKGNKSKNEPLGHNQVKKLLHSKGNNQQN